MKDFTEFDNPQELYRYLAVRTVDKVVVYGDFRYKVFLNHEKEYRKICGYLQRREAAIV